MKTTIYYFLLISISLFLGSNDVISQTETTQKQIEEKKLSEGELLIEKYGCLACHKTYGPKVGPAYHGVSIKYREEFAENAADSIALYIKKGSTGKYPCSKLEGAIMPPFNIPKEERMAIANWIVTLRPMKDMYRKQDENEK